MEIKRAPSGRNAYWFENLGQHQILHVGCFAEDVDKSVEVYADLLTRFYKTSPSLWIEFQSTKRWWLNQRRRDRKLAWKAPVYKDESYLAFEVTENSEIPNMLNRFWLLKELRCYFWNEKNMAVQPRDILPSLARADLKDTTRYVPSVARFIAERDMCNSYLRFAFERNEATLASQLLADSAAKFDMRFVLEASVFKAGGEG